MRLGDLDNLKVHISELMLVYSGTELNTAILNAIDNAPTVAPKKGEWIKIGEIGLAYKCNRCGEVTVVPTKFCPHCGAAMRSVESHLDNTPTVAINKDFYKTDKSNPINRSDLFQ